MDVNHVNLGIELIKNIGKENDFKIEGSKYAFSIFKEKAHSESFKIKKDASGNNDLLVYQWEDSGYSKHCIYSLRSISDVVKFSNVLIASTDIRGGRNRV